MNHGFQTSEILDNLLRPILMQQIAEQFIFDDSKSPLFLTYTLIKLQTSNLEQRQHLLASSFPKIVQALLDAEQEWTLSNHNSHKPKGERRNGSRKLTINTISHDSFIINYPRNRVNAFSSRIITPNLLKDPKQLEQALASFLELGAKANNLKQIISSLSENFNIEVNAFIIVRFLIKLASLMSGWNAPPLEESYLYSCCQKYIFHCQVGKHTVPVYVHLLLATNLLMQQQVLHLSVHNEDNEELWVKVFKELKNHVTYMTKIYTYHPSEQPLDIIQINSENPEQAIVRISPKFRQSTTTSALVYVDQFHANLKASFQYSYFFYYA